jgi:hypothetical protein
VGAKGTVYPGLSSTLWRRMGVECRAMALQGWSRREGNEQRPCFGRTEPQPSNLLSDGGGRNFYIVNVFWVVTVSRMASMYAGKGESLTLNRNQTLVIQLIASWVWDYVYNVSWAVTRGIMFISLKNLDVSIEFGTHCFLCSMDLSMTFFFSNSWCIPTIYQKLKVVLLLVHCMF